MPLCLLVYALSISQKHLEKEYYVEIPHKKDNHMSSKLTKTCELYSPLLASSLLVILFVSHLAFLPWEFSCHCIHCVHLSSSKLQDHD